MAIKAEPDPKDKPFLVSATDKVEALIKYHPFIAKISVNTDRVTQYPLPYVNVDIFRLTSSYDQISVFLKYKEDCSKLIALIDEVNDYLENRGIDWRENKDDQD